MPDWHTVYCVHLRSSANPLVSGPTDGILWYLSELTTLHIIRLAVKTIPKGVMHMDGQELVKQTLDQIPQANANAKRITGLIKTSGRVTGYQLSDNTIVEKQQAVNMARQGQIAGVGIAHRGDTEYL